MSKLISIPYDHYEIQLAHGTFLPNGTLIDIQLEKEIAENTVLPEAKTAFEGAYVDDILVIVNKGN